GEAAKPHTKVQPDDKQIFTILERGPKAGDFVQLDPQQLYYGSEYQVAKAIFVGLLQLDKDSKVAADGAESWTVSPDGLTYTFKIRSGVKWSDGTAIAAQDFGDAIARSQDPCIRKGKPAITSVYLSGGAVELLTGSQALLAEKCPKDASGNALTAFPN